MKDEEWNEWEQVDNVLNNDNFYELLSHKSLFHKI